MNIKSLNERVHSLYVKSDICEYDFENSEIHYPLIRAGEQIPSGLPRQILLSSDIIYTLTILNGIKVLLTKKKQQPVELLAQQNNPDLLRSFSHPNIIKYLGYDQVIRTTVLEWANQLDLKVLMGNRHFTAPLGTRASIMRQLTDALTYLHDRHILHRNLKRSSVLIHYNGSSYQAKLSEFDYVKQLSTDSEVYTTEQLVEMSLYTAPELHDCSMKQYSKKTDVFALGVIGYVVASLPVERFRYSDSFEVLTERLKSAINDISNAHSLPFFAKFIHDCINIDPNARSTASSLYRELCSFVENEPTVFNAAALAPLGKGVLNADNVIGLGSFATIHVPTMDNTAEVVLKKLKAKHSRDIYLLEKFACELKLQRELNHPNLARLIAYDLNVGLAMFERANCSDLSIIIQMSPAKISSSFRYRVIYELIDVISYLQERRILHRDLKPANIFLHQLGAKCHIKLGDFGLATVLPEDKENLIEHFQGTVEYVALETLVDNCFSFQSEVYAVGMIAYAIATHKEPYCDLRKDIDTFCQKYSPESRQKIVDFITLNPLQIPEKIPADFKDVINACCQSDPKNRPSIQGLRQMSLFTKGYHASKPQADNACKQHFSGTG
ncbi:protein kinase family protein [bacterium]|nr:protein kinase family protein [bacterium]